MTLYTSKVIAQWLRKRATNGLHRNTGTILAPVSGHSLFPMKTKVPRVSRSTANSNTQPIQKSFDLRKS